MKSRSNWFRRSIAMLLAALTIVGVIPAVVFADASETVQSSSYTPGDADGNSRVNLSDASIILKHIARWEGLSINLPAADVNSDAVVNVSDVSTILKFLAGWQGVVLKPGKETTENYSVNFYDGERLIDTLTVEKGQPLGAVPAVDKSSKANAILLGYFTDPEFTQPFYAENPVTGDMTVYAKYEEMGSTEELTFDSFAQMDQAADMTFEVIGDGDPATAVTLEVMDGTDPVELKFEASDGSYIVSAVDGFNEGSSYQLHLADGWTFKDKHETIRTASFSIAKEQVENLRMSDDIIYIEDTDLIKYTVGGKTYDVLNSELVNTGGKFTYSGAVIKAGDILCIYTGTHPEQRGADGDAMDPAIYVKATKVTGSTVMFGPLGEDDFLKLYNIPDNFPIKVNALPAGATGTVNISALDTEMYTLMMGDGYNLAKAKNAIEVGDFVSLFVSKDSIQSEDDLYFGEITAYKATTGEITYKKTTKQAILESMDLYRDIEISGDDLVTEEEKAEIEATLLEQITECGFAEDAAFMLADIVTKTDGFKNAGVESITVTDSKGSELSPEELQLLNLGASFELTDDIKTTVEIITKGDQLHYKKGTQIAVGIEAEFEVELEDDEKIAIELSATFVQEVELNPRVKGYVIPYIIFFIPVPVGADVSGSIDIKSFTAFSFEAEIFTVAPEEKSLFEQFKEIAEDPRKLAELPGMPEELSKGLNTVGDVFDKIEELEDNMAKVKDKAEQYQGYAEDLEAIWAYVEENGLTTREDWAGMCDALDKTSITSDLLDMMDLTNETELETEYYESMEALMERYCEMVEKETDWVTLISEDICEPHFFVYGIDISVDVDFMVRADLSLAIGSNLQYEVGKRYEFWFKFAPFYKKAGCTSMDLLDEKFAFQFYVMGRLGLKAGIKVALQAGIGSTWLANIGVSLELGPYMKLWGFFVYEYEKHRAANTSEWLSDERMAGALLMEFGLYMKMAFEAEALKYFTYDYEFIDEEFPLLTVGDERFYYQPSYEPEEDETIRVEDKDENSSNGISMTLPDYTTALKYLDMKQGQLAIESPDYSKFIYTVSNPNFSIDSKTGEISVNVPEGIRYMECDLTITYKYGKMAFSTYDMTVTVPLVWTNMTDAELSEYYTASVRVGNDTDGYTIVWQKRVQKNSEFDLPTEDEIKEIIGWNDYKYEMAGGYGSQKIEDLTLIDNKSYDFIIDYKTYSITVDGVQNADGTTSKKTFTAKFGEKFDFSALESTGTNNYNKSVFTKFSTLTAPEGIDLSKAIDTRMAAALLSGVTATANYVDNSVTATFTFVGIVANSVTIILRRGDTPSLDLIDSIVFEHGKSVMDFLPVVGPMTSSGIYNVICGELKTDPATITFEENGGSKVDDITKPYGSVIGALPTPKKTGHTFKGWYTDAALTALFTETKFPKGGVTLYAKWTANQYTVTFNVNGGNALENNKMTVTYGKTYGTLPTPERSGYGFIGWFTTANGGKQITSNSAYTTSGNQTLYAQWRELIDLSVDYNVDVMFKSVTYLQGKSYSIEHFSIQYSLPEGLTPNDFTYEFICEGYEDEGYFTDVSKAGTWGVKVSRPADDTYAKFEDFQPGVLVIEQATRDLTGVKVSQVGNSLTYIELKLGSEIADLDENAQVRFAFGTKILNVFLTTSHSDGVSYKESTYIRDLTPDTTYKLLRVYVTGDRNYKDVSYDITDTTYTTTKPSGDSWANHADTSWYTSHTDYTDYYITRPAQLAGLAKLVNDGTTTFSGKKIHVSSTLDMSAYTWTPIGYNNSRYFAGEFYGQNCTISGLYYSNSSTVNVGLFGYVRGGTDNIIRDVVVDNSYFYGDSRVGGIVGCGYSAYIYNCTNYAIIRADQKGSAYESCAGGIAGEIENSWVYNCVNYGSVYSEGRLTGGIVGLIDSDGYVSNCVNFGSVTGSSRVGGIVGCTDGKYTYVENCYNVGNVRPNDGSNDYIGAIVGRNVDDKGDVSCNYYLKDCAKGGNGKSRYALGNDGGSVTDGNKGYLASSFETLESKMNSSAGVYADMILLDALNTWSAYYEELSEWVYTGPNGYPLPQLSPVSALRGRWN